MRCSRASATRRWARSPARATPPTSTRPPTRNSSRAWSPTTATSRASTPPASTSTAWWRKRRSRKPAARPTTRKPSSPPCAASASPTRRAGRSTSTISATSSATSTSAAASARTASSSTRRSRPTRTSASSGPTTRSGSWRSRSTRATIRRSRAEASGGMNLWLLAANSIAFGGLLFLLSSGFALIFGLMRIPNLTHGSLFMLGAYFGVSLIAWGVGFWPAALAGGLGVAVLGGLIERLLLRRLPGAELAQVLVTLGLSFMIADLCLMQWGGDPISIETPAALRGASRVAGVAFPTYRLGVIVIAVVCAAALWAMLERTRLGAMIRAGVDDPVMARAVGIRVPLLFTVVFCLGSELAGFAGVIGGPILSVYPGLDQDMLPLALVVVILGGSGSLVGAFVGSFVVGLLYNFGQALLPELAYVVLFLPMLVVLVVRPAGLFGRSSQ